MRPRKTLRKYASALVTTLMVITLLTIIVVAFLQSMTLERKTAQSYSSMTKAKMAADAGTEEAIATLRQLFQNYPDSATAWVTNMAPTGSTNVTPGTAFYYFTTPNVTNTSFVAANNLYFRPLISGATNVPVASRATALSGVTNLTNWINLNSSNLLDGKVWIGRAPGATADPKIDLPWVEITNGTNVVARYAYWVEDESFRVNLNVSSNTLRGANSLGTNTAEIPIQGALRGAVASSATRDSLATNIINVRNKLPFGGDLRSLRNINYADAAYTNLSDSVGFVTTIYSSALNVSRTGARRVNLNAIVGTNTSPSDLVTMQKELSSIVTVLTNQVPLFGQRFYRTVAASTNSPGVTTAHALIYDYKIAANIRDYIDSDSVPTIVNVSGTVINTASPGNSIGAFGIVNPYAAIGKENVPRLQEGIMHVRQQQMETTAGRVSPYDLRINYYIEFWNMGTRDIKIGPDSDANTDNLPADSFLGISNQVPWKRQDGNPIPQADPMADFKLNLADFVDGTGQPLVFKAGKVTVLATSPNLIGNASLFPFDLNSVYRPKATVANFDVPPFHLVGSVDGGPQPSGGGFNGVATLVAWGRQGTPTAIPTQAENNWDAETEVFLGCSTGWLESRLGAVVIRPGIYADSIFSNRKNSDSFHWRGGVLPGDTSGTVVAISSPGQMGDPRANNEQLSFASAGASDAQNRTEFFRTRGSAGLQSAANSSDYVDFTPGAPNSKSTRPEGWDEANNSRTTNTFDLGGSPAYIQNGALRSTAELGHIYDPARGVPQGAGAVANITGGGRTLRIGQSEALPGAGSGFAFWDGNLLSASARWAAWRLLDVFSVTDELQTKGAINPNGALRDNGAAVVAALEGFVFSASNQFTDSKLANIALSASDTAMLASSLTNYLANPNKLPFFDRGQLAEIDFFNTNSLPSVTGATTMTTVNDRGREEMFRRMAEMITTKGNTYSVYAIGQSLMTLPNGQKRPVATSMHKVTFRLTPQYASTNLLFNPVDTNSVSNRFANPTNYAVQILSEAN